jgi:hypothetical protein
LEGDREKPERASFFLPKIFMEIQKYGQIIDIINKRAKE